VTYTSVIRCSLAAHCSVCAFLYGIWSPTSRGFCVRYVLSFYSSLGRRVCLLFHIHPLVITVILFTRTAYYIVFLSSIGRRLSCLFFHIGRQHSCWSVRYLVVISSIGRRLWLFLSDQSSRTCCGFSASIIIFISSLGHRLLCVLSYTNIGHRPPWLFLRPVSCIYLRLLTAGFFVCSLLYALWSPT
jgi:hypothetical protein